MVVVDMLGFDAGGLAEKRREEGKDGWARATFSPEFRLPFSRV